jgi:hypothetical protein
MKQISSLIFVLFLSLGGCDTTSVTPPRTNQQDTLQHRDNFEAEMAALWVSRNLLATDYYYNLFDLGFSLVREEYEDSIPEVWIRFQPPWHPGSVDLKITEETKVQLRNGLATCLDSLNLFFGITDIDTSFLGRYNNINVTSSTYYHPKRMAERYLPLPCVMEAYAASWGRANELGCYPWLITGGSNYLFRSGWDDCPSGCVYNNVWYFRVIGTDVEYVGIYNTETDPEPYWWPEARTAYLFMAGIVTGIP